MIKEEMTGEKVGVGGGRTREKRIVGYALRKGEQKGTDGRQITAINNILSFLCFTCHYFPHARTHKHSQDEHTHAHTRGNDLPASLNHIKAAEACGEVYSYSTCMI